MTTTVDIERRVIAVLANFYDSVERYCTNSNERQVEFINFSYAAPDQQLEVADYRDVNYIDGDGDADDSDNGYSDYSDYSEEDTETYSVPDDIEDDDYDDNYNDLT